MANCHTLCTSTYLVYINKKYMFSLSMSKYIFNVLNEG